MGILTLPPVPPPHTQRRFTVAEYHKLIDVGVITKRDRCHLIRGFIVEKPPLNPPHATTLGKLNRHLSRMLPPSVSLCVQQPITLGDSEPEPDFAVVSGTFDDYEAGHPTPDDILFVVEIADSSLREDQTAQLVLYAENRVPEYWIVNLQDRRVEVYTQPKRGKSPSYRHRKDYGPEDAVPVTVGGRAVGSVPVREILPK